MSTMEFKCLYAITLGPDSILVNARGLKKQSTCRTRLQPTVVLVKLCIHTVRLNTTLLFPSDVVLTCELGESPLAGGNYLLTTRKLKLCTAEGLNSLNAMHILRSDGEHDLTDGDARRGPLHLAESAAHAGLETIRSGA